MISAALPQCVCLQNALFVDLFKFLFQFGDERFYSLGGRIV
jgi:hypothetical protein